MAKKMGGMMSGGGQGGMMRRLQTLQEDVLKAQEEVAALVVTGTAGGGAVTATITGTRRLQSLSIQRDVVDPADVEMLQDLIVAAVNQAFEQLEKESAQKMGAVTGVLGGLGMDLGL